MAAAPAGETAGMVGEVKRGKGRVELKPAAGADWRAVRPLAALRAGDALRATEDAAVVVVLSGGRGTRYTLRVLAGRQSPQESWFEFVAPTRAEEVQADVAVLAL